MKGCDNMTYYVLDHRYEPDHEDFCRIVASDRNSNDVGEILTAIQFYWEEHVDESSNPDLDDVLAILEKYFGFEPDNNCDHYIEIKFVLAAGQDYGVTENIINGRKYEYIDLYSTREHYCGPGKPQQLYRKWLTADGILTDIIKCKTHQ